MPATLTELKYERSILKKFLGTPWHSSSDFNPRYRNNWFFENTNDNKKFNENSDRLTDSQGFMTKTNLLDKKQWNFKVQCTLLNLLIDKVMSYFVWK